MYKPLQIQNYICIYSLGTSALAHFVPVFGMVFFHNYTIPILISVMITIIA